MQRMGWLAGTGLGLVLCASAAKAQSLDFDDLPSDEPRLGIEIGRSPTQAGFALEIEGGAPFAQALLTLCGRGGLQQRSLVALDEQGGARIVERNYEVDVALQVTAVVPLSLGRAPRTATLTAQLQPASTMPQPQFLSAPGDVVISEIMKDPSFVSDAAGEWFEVKNRTTQPIDLEGWTISDSGGSQHTIHGTGGVWLPARAYFVFGINSNIALNGGVQVAYKYSSFTLANGADDIQLKDSSGALIDAVAYDDGIFWPDSPGKSLTLSRALIDAVSNDDGANSCDALSPMAGGNTDFGTPRVANNTCP